MKTEKENRELKELFKSVRKVLVKKGLLKEEVLPEEKEKLCVPEKSKQRRQFPRLKLNRDFNKTIILRIKRPDKSENIKSFANNINLGGLCFETQREFRKNSKLNLRLFFYGDQIPMMKIQARIVWKKKIEITNRYGASFDLIEEKDREALNQYVEANIRKE